MVNRELEIQIKRLKEFMQLWIKFHDMYKDAISRDTITPEDEATFLETKSLIARKFQALRESLDIGSSYEYRTFDVISQVLSLKGVSDISDLGMHKIENDWHSSYILLNKILGELEGRQDALRRTSRLGLTIRSATSNPVFNLLLAILVIFAAYIIFVYVQESYTLEKERKGKIEFRAGEEKAEPER